MFQKKVTSYNEITGAWPGQIARASIATETLCYPLKNTVNKVPPGVFVIADINSSTKDIQTVTLATGNITDKYVVGVTLMNTEKTASTVPGVNFEVHSPIMIIVRGSVNIKATADAQAGYYVHLKNSDATLAFDKSKTKNEHLYTGWQVTEGGKNGSIIIISKID